tara:strand:+ start:37 stop:651 length:615 start_codon:yes stop_codon:yes gene_type:complete
MINSYQNFNLEQIEKCSTKKNINGTSFIPYKNSNYNGVFFQTPLSEISNIETNGKKRFFTIFPVNDLENFFNFNVEIDNYTKDSIKDLSITLKNENYVSPRKISDDIQNPLLFKYKANLNSDENIDCLVYDQEKNIIEDDLKIGDKVYFILRLSGTLYNNHKIVPCWTIEQIKLVNEEINTKEIIFSECMINDDNETNIEVDDF